MDIELFHKLLGRFKPTDPQTKFALAKLAIEYVNVKEQTEQKQFKFISYGRISSESEGT